MDDQAARLTFYEGYGDDTTPIGPVIESTHIPRPGEIVFLTDNDGNQEHWTVRRVRYLYPQPGSVSWATGSRTPLVDLLVSRGPADFWLSG